MKKTINYIVLLLIMLIPLNVFAINYELGTPVDGKGGVKYIPIKVTGTQGLYATEVLSCATTNDSTTECKIEAGSGYVLKDNMIKSATEDTLLTEGAEVGRLAVTNKVYEDITTSVLFKVNDETKITVDNVTIGHGENPDPSLTSVTVSAGTIDPQFNGTAEEQNYTVYGIADTVNNIKFTWTCADCSVKVSGGTQVTAGKVYLATGENQVTLVSKSQNGENEKTYKFTVIRGEAAYNSLKLKTLEVTGFDLNPTFKADTKEYEVKVPKKVESLSSLLKFTTEDEKATTKVEGADNFTEDEHEVKITVTNRTGETAEYKIKVIREDDTPQVIEVIGYKDEKVSYINPDGIREELGKDEFKEKYPDEWAKIENNTYQFDEDGNIIKEKNETKEPTNTENKKSFPWIIIVLIVVSIIIIGVAGFLIFRDPKKKDTKKEENIEPKVEPTVTPLNDISTAPVEEQKAELNRIDTYDEEARLEADNTVPQAPTPVEPQETVIKEEVIDNYVDDSKTPTTDIDEALSDLMNTKEYNFRDKE